MNRQNSMAQQVSLADQGIKTNATIERFLELVQTETKEKVDEFLLPLIRTAENGRNSQNKPLEQLQEALAQSDVVEVWKLIVKINETDGKKTDSNETNSNEINSNETDGKKNDSKKTNSKKTDRNESDSNETNSKKTLEDIIKFSERKNNDEDGCHFKCSWYCKKIGQTIMSAICDMFNCNEDEPKDTATEMPSEEDRRWIEVFSNPLYISLEWLWRKNPNSHYKTKGLLRRKESKLEDIIEAALDDAYLLEKFASHEHVYSRDEYKRRAEEFETFAADIVQQVGTSDLNQLHEILDIKGDGPLGKKKEEEVEEETKTKVFNQSLGLLKVAADKRRKRVGICLNSYNIKIYASTLKRNIYTQYKFT